MVTLVQDSPYDKQLGTERHFTAQHITTSTDMCLLLHTDHEGELPDGTDKRL